MVGTGGEWYFSGAGSVTLPSLYNKPPGVRQHVEQRTGPRRSQPRAGNVAENREEW